MKEVLVTGGSGYLAGWAIVGLLRAGHRVRTTLRSARKEAAVRAAVAGQIDSDDRLSFHLADLTGDAGWAEAVRGCDVVLHVASPMGQGLPRDTDLLGPARDGTLRVLRASAEAGVSRVVLTSSVAAALPPPGTPGPTDESVWTDVGAPAVDNYARSKTLAERAAWKFMDDEGARRGLTLTTVLPGLVLGPLMADEVSGSVGVIERLLTGKVPASPNVGFALVDVRDLVDLHVAAMDAPAAAGQRFVAAHDFLWLREMAAVLRERYGARAAKVPTRAMPDFVVKLAALVQEDARFLAPKLGQRREFTSAKGTRLLGWHPRAGRQTVVDTAESLFARGLA